MERALVPTYLAGQEQARTVLGVQPPPPRTAPLRYASVETNEQSLEIVLDYGYYYESEQSLIDLNQGAEVEQQIAPRFSNPGINQLLYVANQGNHNLQPTNDTTTIKTYPTTKTISTDNKEA